MSEDRIEPNRIMLNALSKKSPKLWRKFSDASVASGGIEFYTSLIERASSSKDLAKIMDRMDKAGLEPNQMTYTALLKKKGTREALKKITKEMVSRGLPFDAVLLTVAIGILRDPDEAMQYLNDAIALGARPNEITCNALLKYARSERHIEQVLALMAIHKIKPSIMTYNLCLAHTKDPRGIIRRIEEQGVSMDATTYANIMFSDLPPRSILKIFDKMISEGIRPNNGACNAALAVCDLAKAHQIVDIMIRNAIAANRGTFSSLYHSKMEKAHKAESEKRLAEYGYKREDFSN